MSKYTKKSPKFFENIREVNGIKERRCSKCKEWKPETTEYFYMRNKSKPEKGFQATCIICSKERTRIWQEENPEKYYNGIDRRNKNPSPTRLKTLSERSKKQRLRGDFKKWARENPDKVKIYSQKHRDHDVSTKEEKSMLEVFDYKCAYCGMTLAEHKKTYHEKLHNDHVIDDGYNDLRNDVPACKPCNCSKHTEDMESWFRRQLFFNETNLDKINWWITDGYKDYIEDKPPYRITKKQNEGLKTFHWELWTVDEMRNMIDLIYIGNKKKDIKQFISMNII